MKKTLLASLLAALFSSAHAFDSFTVKDIRVEGIQRTEAGTVFNYLPVKVGDTLTNEKASQAIKALFATGFFKDVRLEIEGDVLVVILDERPAIAAIDFTGMKVFEKDPIKKALKEIGLSESRIFDRAMLEKAEQELKRQYLSRGYYAANVTTTVTPLERNRISIAFSVEEGDIAKIRQINIIGSKAFSEKDLLELFQLRTPGWFTWYTKNDQYSKQKLSADLEVLRSHYLDRGYLEFNVDSTQVSISPDKQDIYITINLTEGEPYSVASVKLAGNLTLPEDVITPLVTIKPGETFSRSKLTETSKAISDRLGNDGYAFANVNAVPELDKEKHLASFTVLVDPGRRVYVRRINIGGNTKTRDEVVRREFRQLESSWYDGSKINRSRERIDRLGYFEPVTVETPPVPGTTDQVDVDVVIKEKSTGNLMLGAGFSSSEKLVLSGSIEQQNIFGSGKSVGVQLNTSKANKVYSFSYTDPYYTPDGVARGFDLYRRKTDTSQLATTIATYGSSSFGGGVRYGIPIADAESIQVGLSADSTSLTLNAYSPVRYTNFVNANGSSFRSVIGSAGWMVDSVDSRLYPTKGVVQKATAEVTMPGSNLKYYRASYQHQIFMPLSKTFTLLLNGEAGFAGGFGGNDLPFWKNFYAGGIGSVRGFEPGTIGPKDTNGDALGGTRRIVGNAELLFPFPGSGMDKSLRLGAFLDAGYIGSKDTTSTTSSSALKLSTGVSVTWSSFMGPLKFSFGMPIKKSEDDKVQRLQFQMGNTF